MIEILRLIFIVLGIIGGLEVVAIILIVLIVASRPGARRNRKKSYSG